MAKVVIAGVGKYLPERIVTNEELVKIFASHGRTETPSGKPLTAEWIEGIVGIKERRWADPKQNTSDLAFLAAEEALKEAGIFWHQLHCVRVGSSSPEAFFPSTACLTLHHCSGHTLHTEAADTLAACTSGLYALTDVYRAMMTEPDYNWGLAAGAEVLASRMTNFKDINDDLWGDGAGAVVLKKVHYNTKSGIICTHLGSEPDLAPLTLSVGKGTRVGDILIHHPSIFLDGHRIQRFVWEILPKIIEETMAKANLILAENCQEAITLQDIDLFAVHQANARIFERPAQQLGIPLEKFYVNVDRYGNTSSASVFIVLAEAMEKELVQKGDIVMLVSFGGGITWGSVLVRL